MKVKITKEEFARAERIYSNNNLPDFIELEGEIVEGECLYGGPCDRNHCKRVLAHTPKSECECACEECFEQRHCANNKCGQMRVVASKTGECECIRICGDYIASKCTCPCHTKTGDCCELCILPRMSIPMCGNGQCECHKV